MPNDETSEYYVIRHRASIAMSESASKPAARNIRLELARRYAAPARNGDEPAKSRPILSLRT